MIFSIRLLLVIIPIILIPALTFSQTTAAINKNSTIIKGSVIEEISHMPLPYINIGVIGKPIGTVSDSTGSYSLTIFIENLKDSLQLSSVGYAVKRILIADLIRQNNVPIELKRKPMTLAEVVVNGTNTRTQIIGRQDSGLLVQVSIHSKYNAKATIGSEMGMLINPEKNGAMLKDYNWFISANNFRKIKFRINIYSVKNGFPDTLIYNKPIYSSVENFKTGWSKINLENYHIKLAGEAVITLQWLEGIMDKDQTPITRIPASISFSKKCFVRIASQDVWKKMRVNLSQFVTVYY